MTKVNQEILDKIVELEADVIANGLQDEELMRSPQFLGRVRAFLKDNEIKTSPEVAGVKTIKRNVKEIPNLMQEIGG